MDLTIINYGSPGGYQNISERLEQSLIKHAPNAQRMIFKGVLPEGSPEHSENPYAFKIYAFEQAIKAGHKKIMWLDSSFYAVKNIQPLYDYVTEHGFHFFRTGYNLAQSVNDRTLKYAGVTRNDAEQMEEYASGMVAFDFDKPICRLVYNDWRDFMQKGYFKGSRVHDNQSQDPRFLFHRQDQSCLSLAMHRHGMRMNDTEMVAYFGGNYNKEKILMFIKGI